MVACSTTALDWTCSAVFITSSNLCSGSGLLNNGMLDGCLCVEKRRLVSILITEQPVVLKILVIKMLTFPDYFV